MPSAWSHFTLDCDERPPLMSFIIHFHFIDAAQYISLTDTFISASMSADDAWVILFLSARRWSIPGRRRSFCYYRIATSFDAIHISSTNTSSPHKTVFTLSHFSFQDVESLRGPDSLIFCYYTGHHRPDSLIFRHIKALPIFRPFIARLAPCPTGFAPLRLLSRFVLNIAPACEFLSIFSRFRAEIRFWLFCTHILITAELELRFEFDDYGARWLCFAFYFAVEH